MSTIKSRGKRAASPVADLEFEEPSEVAPNQDLIKNGGGPNGPVGDEEKLIFRIRQASSDLYKKTKHPASNAAIAEILGEDESNVKSARDSLKLARKNQRLAAMRKKALQVGFSRRKDISRAEALGLDTERTLLTPGDIKRMMNMIPMEFEKGSFDHEQLKMRMELAFERLPLGVAREITSFIEPFFRQIINECVERQVRGKAQRINASTMKAVLDKYQGLGVFTSIAPPEGLVQYCKKAGVEHQERGNSDSGHLLNASAEDKKKWKAEKVKNKNMADQFNSMLEHEKERLAKKNKRGAEEATEEVPEEALQVQKKKKKKVAKDE